MTDAALTAIGLVALGVLVLALIRATGHKVRVNFNLSGGMALAVAFVGVLLVYAATH